MLHNCNIGSVILKRPSDKCMLAQLRNLVFSTDIPLRSRRTYQRELLTAATMPVALGLIEGDFLAVLAKEGFDAPKWIIATLIAAPIFSNLSSFLWARIAVGRPRVPMIVALMTVNLILVASLALMPNSRIGLYQLTATTIAIGMLLTGIITLRSTVWRHNYRRDQRAAITSRLSLLVMFLSATLPALAGLWLDMAPQAFRIFYPVSASIAAVGIISFSRVRIQGERTMLRFERKARPQSQPHGEGALLYEVPDRISSGVRLMELLRKDRVYRQYLIWQFLLGSSSMMLKPVLVLAVMEVFDTDYRLSSFVFVLVTLPLIMAMLSMLMWAKLLDHMHVIRFRSIQSLVLLCAFLLLFIGIHWQMMAVVVVAQVMEGICRGGGTVAWQLGHNDFASRHMVAAYMGTHVTLTGLRGLIAPYLGTLLYGGFHVIGFKGIGDIVFLLAASLALIGSLGFITMRRQMVRPKLNEAAA